MKIVLATHNRDKCAEMLAILGDMPIEFLSLNEFPKIGAIIEDGKTLYENAFIKAKAIYKLTNLPAIAGLTSAADKGIQFSGSGTAAVYDLTAAGKALLDELLCTENRGGFVVYLSFF